MSSANAFNLDKPKVLSLGKSEELNELNKYSILAIDPSNWNYRIGLSVTFGKADNINSLDLPNDKTLNQSKLKAFADDKIYMI